MSLLNRRGGYHDVSSLSQNTDVSKGCFFASRTITFLRDMRVTPESSIFISIPMLNRHLLVTFKLEARQEMIDDLSVIFETQIVSIDRYMCFERSRIIHVTGMMEHYTIQKNMIVHFRK